MTSRTRRLAMTAGGVVVAGILFWSFIPGSSEPAMPSAPEPAYPSSDTALSVPSSPAATPTPLASLPAGGSVASARATYAIGLHELAGLAPDIQPGTVIEVWATWEPPLTEEVLVQRLLRDVVVERVIPPVLPEGPTSILLSVPARDIRDLLFGDRYGELSAVTPG